MDTKQFFLALAYRENFFPSEVYFVEYTHRNEGRANSGLKS
jgi:hypothetical protein